MNAIYGFTHCFGYPSVPPYDASGHDWRQWAVLQAALAARGFTLTGKVIDSSEYPKSGADQGYLNGMRVAARDSYTWACDIIDGIEISV